MPDSLNNPTPPDRAVASARVDPPPLPRKLKITLPGYKLGNTIASGGQAIVIKAVQESSGKDVAVKLLREGPLADDAARSRLQREVAVLAALKHPNIGVVIDHGVTPEGLDYLVMNFVDGKLLNELIQGQSGPDVSSTTLAALLKIFTRICAAMHAAHLHSIVHRDLSPSNILIDAQGEPHILDFGLARTAFDRFISGGRSLSSVGQFIGKPQYASPEQARGEPDKIDIRTDVYALGIILYQILTGGNFPYSVTGNFVEVLSNIVNEAPTPPSRQIASGETQKRHSTESFASTRYPAGVTRVLEAIAMKALEKDPQNRYQSAGEFGRDVENYLAGKPTVAHFEVNRFGPTTPPPKFTNWRIVLGGTAIILTICGWAVFHFLSVQSWLPDFGSSASEPLTTDTAATVGPPGPPAMLPPRPMAGVTRSASPSVSPIILKAPGLPPAPPGPSIVSNSPPALKVNNPSGPAFSTPHNDPPAATPSISPPGKGQPVDLLSLVEANDVLKGKWTKTPEGIESNAATAVLKLRYAPSGEYDFAVTFTCKSGNDIEPRNRRGMCQILSYGGHDFGWVIGYDECWFVQENGPRDKPGLTIGRTYTSVVKVRHDTVSAYLDGAPVIVHEGYSELRPVEGVAGIPDGTLALITIDTPTVFHSLEVTPIGQSRAILGAGPPTAPPIPK